MLAAMRLFLFVQPLLVILLTLTSAAAQTAPAAEALYRRGVADFQAGRYEAACRALAESYRLEPLPGVLFTLATCEARAGRVASSAAHYQDFLQFVERLPPEQRVLQQEREQVALAERRALLPDVPTLQIELSGDLPEGARVLCDGAEIGGTMLGQKVPLDPGMHVVQVVSAAGGRSEKRVSLARREHASILLELPNEVGVPGAAVLHDARRPLVLAASIVGGVGLGTGLVAGAFAFKHKRDVDDHCEGTLCDAAGKRAADKGQRAALVSTIGWGIGATGLAVALILHFTRGSDERSRADNPLSHLTLTDHGIAFGDVF